MAAHSYRGVAQTGGRSWDGGLQVYNNPIPRWWLGLLIVAAVFALGYWLLYPSWPLPGRHYRGILEVELEGARGSREVVDWSTAAELQAWRDRDRVNARQQRLATAVARSDYPMLSGDQNMRNYLLGVARVPYLDQCAVCHGVDGRGAEGDVPAADLVAGDWRKDAGFAEIEQRVRAFARGAHGDVKGAAPAAPSGEEAAGGEATGRFSDLQIRALTVYVHQLGRRPD